jgi:hypothetical protein
MKWTRAQVTAEAAALAAGATAKLDGARDGDQAASDTSLSPRERQVAAACASTLREQASDMRGLAAALRDGVSPDELGYVR